MDGFQSLIERLPAGMVSTHHGELATHAHDRWSLAMLQEARGDRVPPPGAVVYPTDTEQVSVALAWATETGTPVVPRGAGTGLAGGAEAIRRGLLLDLSRLNRVLAVDEVSQAVRTQAGARGSAVEDALSEHGLTLGHEPVTARVSTVGGWIAAAASGAASAGYGRIEDLLLGARAVLADGTLVELKDVPRSAAGPDLRRLLVGSEGTLAVVTEATLAAARAPAGHGWEVFVPNSFDAGLALAREVAQRPFRPLVVRLLDAPEAAAAFAGFGHPERPLLIVGFDTGAPAIEAERFELRELAREVGARAADPGMAAHWWERRFEGLAWYESVMGPERSLGAGVIVEMAEFAALWRRVPRLYEEVRGALFDHAESVTCRLTDPYPAGASLLFTFTIRAADDHTAEAAYLAAWDAAAGACLDAGGTVTHNHGLGLLKAPYAEDELGSSAALLRRIKAALDPAGVLNPGKQLPSQG